MIDGLVEAIEASRIRGWALAAEESDDRLLIELFVRGRLRGSTWAETAPAGPANGSGSAGHGFVIEFSKPLGDADLADIEIYATAASGERARIPAAAPKRAGNGHDEHPARVSGMREEPAIFERAPRRNGAAAPAEDNPPVAANLEARLEAASEALEQAQAAAASAEEVAGFLVSGVRALAARLTAEARSAAPSPPAAPEDEDPNEAAPEFPEYWLPDGLREYIGDRFGEAAVPAVRELMAIISRHEHDRAGFAGSHDCRALVAKLRRLAPDSDPDRPIEVSIVIPVYNGLVYTLTCLYALLTLPSRHRFEILVGDNASEDGTGDILPRIGGRVRHVRHRENLGFLLNCNVAALQARGRWIVLLNNDTIALPDWLDELIATFLADDAVGLAGSKLLNDDGTLQEAGGIYWNDGTAWNFGHGQNPRLPEFNYVKEVDYCTGAAVALPRAVWTELGGFDPWFVPAYCEDADLAFRVRASGRKVVYNPFSEIVHHEGKTHGRDTSSGMKAYQVKNTKKLLERWWRVLRSEHYPDATRVFAARDRSRRRPHILVVDHYVPQWERDAGSRTIYQFLRFFLRHGFQVSFWPDNLYRDPDYAPRLQRLGIEVLYAGPGHTLDFEDWIARNGEPIDYVLLSRASFAVKYIDAVRAYTAARVLYYGHDLPWKRLQQEFAVTGDPAFLEQAEAARALEDRMCAAADLVLYLTEEECASIRQLFPGRNVVETPGFVYDEGQIEAARARLDAAPARDRHHLLFVGGFQHRPNGDAVRWFVGEVLPLLRARDPRFRLTVIGSNPPEEVCALTGPGVTVAGEVDDVRLGEFYREVGAAVVPLRFGAGLKGKVIEAFANGTPLVTTPVGLQGIPDGEALAWIAEAPAAFAERVIEAVGDPAAATRRARAALDLIARRYSRQAIFDSLSPHIPELRAV